MISTLTLSRGVWAMIAVFLAYCTLQAPSTILIRPHPAVWRLVHGLAVVYLVALTFLLFQNRDDARQFMKHLYPDLGVELPERSYGADCRLYVPENPKNKFINIYDTLFDEFVVAHVLGWWGKAVMIRNQSLLWVLSIGFELMELTFRHMLPNFNECWWDSIILDILICNWFGIWAGMHTVRYFDGKTYEWVGLSRQPSIMGEKIIEPVHSGTVGQGSMAALHGAATVRPSAVPLRRFHDGGAQHIFPQILPLDPSKESLGCVQIDPLVADCYSDHPRVQLLLARQETSEEGWCLLLALCSHMHSGASYLYEVWAWTVP
ncbi:hypothetical protein BRADI_2g17230v3 [Brachypodium distachyon]|uniref:CDP-diacylglycerol--serine O-phosphatidyltransferase n=1 Tax=Brachypodium distachyon TaxID=15368 RepID=A0A2K2D8Z3_BRADI|nr:hypothetical protein BRADI_2g17230v3 [Brachypodium distachyon]